MNKLSLGYLCIVCAFLLLSCSRPQKQSISLASEVQYASLLKMETLGPDATFVSIANPWHPDVVASQYLLVRNDSEIPSEKLLAKATQLYGPTTLLRTPLTKQTITSTCHAWLLSQFNAINSIAVMCDIAYVHDSLLKQRIDEGFIANGGNGMVPDAEVLFAHQSDAIWISPFEGASLSPQITRKIPVIYCADYMETSPLGRAEWMKFYGRLVGKGNEADSLFNIVVSAYDSICDLTKAKYKLPEADNSVSSPATMPTVFSDLPYSGTWFVPGGQSTIGQLYRDAGLLYPWANDEHVGSLSLSPETVLAKARKANIWLIKYNDTNINWQLADLLPQHRFFPEFEATKSGHVYGCNTARNNYFDVTPFRPDWLLEELKFISEDKSDSLSFFVRMR